MASALIVIEIAASKVSDDALAVLVSSCTRAARGAECALAKNASDASPSAVAIVTLKSEDTMRVEVGVRQGDHDSWRTKDFAFLAEDETLDRWRLIGFAIGTLAESNPEPSVETPAPPAPPRPAPMIVPAARSAPAVRAAPPPPPPWRLFVAAVGVVGPGLDKGPWRIGSGLRAELAPPWPLYFTLGGSAAMRVTGDGSGAAARWVDVSVGAGTPLVGSLSHSGIQLGASLLAERFDVSASSLDRRSDSRGRWLLGGEASLGGRVEVLPHLFITADVEAAGLSASTDVAVAGTSIGVAPSFRYLGSFGLRVRLR